MSKICVIGSMNMDMVINVKMLPKKGETLLVDRFEKIPGGKGANQAVAAQRLGSEVCMIAQIGKDHNGHILLKSLKQDGINTNYVYEHKSESTGLAVITVDEVGNNTIAVIPGANMAITVEDVKKAEEIIKSCRVLISQLETPIESAVEAFKIAKKNNIITILNPAPANEIPSELIAITDIIIPNETEAYELTNIEVKDLNTAKEAADVLLAKGVGYVIITLGDKGAALITEKASELIKPYKVNAVDTTAAGDSFIGALASKLSDEDSINFENIKKAVRFANKVSSIAVTKKGAQSSLPYLQEVTEKYGEE